MRARLHACGVAMRTGTVLTEHRARRAALRGRRRPGARARRRGGRARHAADLARRALPRARRPAGRPSSAWATASRRGCSPRRSSTATGWHARSTATIPRSRLPYLRERVGDSDELPAAPAPAPLAALPPRPPPARAVVRARRGHGDRRRAHRRAAARRRSRRRSWPSAPVPATRSSAGACWPSATARASRSRARRSRRAAPRAASSSAPRARPSRPTPTSRSASRARSRTSSAWPAAARSSPSTAIRGARIFEYADLGVAADAGELLDALLALT